MTTITPSSLVMLHLGLGSFHRAHQAVYMHQLIQSGDTRWSLAGGNIRPDMAETIAALVAQQGEYTLETISPTDEHSYTRITSIKEVIPFTPDLAGLIARAIDPGTRIISFTVTEAGYYLDANDKLDPASSEIAADLAAVQAGRPGSTIYGALAVMLKKRMLANAGPLTLLCCDNLRHNGDRSRSGLLQFIAKLGDDALLAWTRANTTSPNDMVDRITPRPAPEVAVRVLAATGWADAAAVMGESFIQWVIEDKFCAGRPEWEKVGAQMVDSVAPYEEAKIRLLNATHSCIAWAGTLVGYQYIHEGTHDAAIRDTNQRVAMDGFSKIPGFITPTVRERLARNESIASVAMLPALFLAYLQRWHRGEIAYTYQDQAMDPAVAHAICEAADPVAAYCADQVLWGELADNEMVVDAVRAARDRITLFVKAHRS